MECVKCSRLFAAGAVAVVFSVVYRRTVFQFGVCERIFSSECGPFLLCRVSGAVQHADRFGSRPQRTGVDC